MQLTNNEANLDVLFCTSKKSALLLSPNILKPLSTQNNCENDIIPHLRNPTVRLPTLQPKLQKKNLPFISHERENID